MRFPQKNPGTTNFSRIFSSIPHNFRQIPPIHPNFANFPQSPQFSTKKFAKVKNPHYLCNAKVKAETFLLYGVLAHLARALHWQCRGERFESAILHQTAAVTQKVTAVFIFTPFKNTYNIGGGIRKTGGAGGIVGQTEISVEMLWCICHRRYLFQSRVQRSRRRRCCKHSSGSSGRSKKPAGRICRPRGLEKIGARTDGRRRRPIIEEVQLLHSGFATASSYNLKPSCPLLKTNVASVM